MNVRALGCGGLCLLLALTQPAFANGVVRDGEGPIASGRGGVNIAYGDNGAVLLNNPAGMSNMPGHAWFEGGIDLLVTDLDYSDPQNGDTDNAEAFPLPTVSYMQRLGDSPWTAGLGVFVPAGFGSDWEMNGPPGFGRQDYKSLGALVKILPGLSCQVTENLSVGATLGVAISHAELEGPFFLQSSLPGAPAVIDLQGTSATPTWSLGLQYRLTENTTIGAVYSSEDRFQFDGSMRADVFLPPPFPAQNPSVFDAEIDLVWPQSLGIGVQHRINDRHRVGADVIWYDWSHAFDRLDLRLTNPSNPMFALFGPAISDSFPLRWKDSVSVRLGYEYQWTCRDILRAGYIYNSDTTPDSTLTPYIPALLNHTVTAGYTRIWNEYWLNFAYQFMFGDESHVGSSALLGGDFSDSHVRSQAHILMMSVGRGW